MSINFSFIAKYPETTLIAGAVLLLLYGGIRSTIDSSSMKEIWEFAGWMVGSAVFLRVLFLLKPLIKELMR